MLEESKKRVASSRGFIITVLLTTFMFLLLLSADGRADQPNGVIKGKVTDAGSGKPLPGTNITVVGTNLGAAAGKDGEFVIRRVPQGEYQLKVTRIGYEPKIAQAVVTANGKVYFQFKLREDLFQMQQIVVTATRTKKLMEDVPVVTELIGREEIDEKGAENLAEVLEDRPGITIESGSEGGKFLYMNGVDSRRILVLVDGIPLAGKLNNRIQLDLIDSDKIDHIEIVKGPGSALYGNDAMGGVINVITRDFTPNTKIRMNGRLGSNDLYSGNISLTGQKKGVGYVLNVDHMNKGFDKGQNEIDIKSSKSSSASGKLVFRNPAAGRIDMQSEYRTDELKSESSFMGSTSNNLSQVKNFNSSAGWEKDLANNSSLKLIGYYTTNLRTYKSARVNSTRPASIDTTTDNILGLKSDFTYNPSELIKFDFGFDYSDNNYDNPRLLGRESRKQGGGFTQVEANLSKKLTLILGGRYDKITDLEGHFSPRVSSMYSFTPNLKLRASYGGGFRAPSFIELYSNFPIPIPGMPLMVVGNSNLKPEKSLGGNFGVEYFWNQFLLVNATLFRNNFQDMIVDYQPAPFTYSYLNVEEATFQGVELQTRFYLRDNLATTLSYNFTDISHKNENVAFSKISPHTAVVRVNYGLFKNKIKIALREKYYSGRDILVVSGHSGDLTKQKKDAYHLADLTISYKLNSMLCLRLGSTNLLDYTDKDYGPWIGRRIFMEISTDF